MDDAFRPRIEPDPAHVPLSADTLAEVLPSDRFADVYRLAQEEGLPYFLRINGQGDVEICLVFESIDDFSESARDRAAIEFRTYRDKLIAVVWTISDPRHPLGFPLRLAVREERDRYAALRLVEQSAVPIHYLAWAEGRLLHIYTEQVTFTPEERERVTGYIRRLYAPESAEAVPAAEEEVREAPVTSVSADALSDHTLAEGGIAYLIDYGRMEARLGAEQAQLVLMESVRQAVLVMRRHPHSEVRESSFTVWAARREESLWLCVTPALTHLFELVDESDEATHPFTRYLLALPEFVGIREARPLALGAYPIVRYERGAVCQVELDESAQKRLAALYEAAETTSPNPYQG